MRQRPSSLRPRTAPHLLLIISLALAGCAGSPTPREQPAEPADDTVMLPGELPDERPAYSDALPPSEYSGAFERAESALARYDWQQAEAALDEVQAPLNANDEAYRAYLLARIAWLHGETPLAEQLLAAYPANATAPRLATMILNFQRYMKRMGGDYLGSARLGSQLLALNPAQATAAALRRSIWRDLERLDSATLEGATSTADPEWQAWLALASISATSRTLDELVPALEQWRQQHPGHPAANPLPGGLEALRQPSGKPMRVALLLPLSGRLAPAARAVRDGYLAAWYAAGETGAGQRELLLVDTHALGNATAAYREAVQRGADIVVGPLSKEGVAELGNTLDRPVPILALNRSEQSLPPGSTALVQLSLSPEDEVETLAELAYGRGARRALIVRPAGEWGEKMDAALREQWQRLGGAIVSTARYASPEAYSDSIAQTFHLEASHQRAREVRSMLATNIEYSARRRQDFDAIFLLSGNPSEARSLKPLLAFHYAGDIPVYATSSIYNGLPDTRDQDLNGIRLVDLPWLLGDSPALRVAIAAGNTGSDSYTRLNALGADAYLVQSRFAQLQAGPDALLRGNTGLLSMDPQLRILREPRPATFDGGELKPL